MHLTDHQARYLSVLVRSSDESEWTGRLRGRGRNKPYAVDTASLPRLVTAVAFDQFVFDERGAAKASGATVVRGTTLGGPVIAVGSVTWPEMPIEWIALQSRRSPDLLGLAGDEMEPAGHRTFDERFAVDADDVSLFRKLFRTSLREWLVEFDDAHGPLIVIFDGSADTSAGTPRRRRTDTPTDVAAVDPATVPTVFVAREVADDDAVVPTLDLAEELTAHIRAAVER